MNFASSFILLLLASSALLVTAAGHRKLLLAERGLGIKNQYIVVYRNGIEDIREKINTFTSRLKRTPNSPLHTFVNDIKGFVVKDLATEDLEELLNDDDVAYVEQVRRASAF
jgi:hypothetical protein